MADEGSLDAFGLQGGQVGLLLRGLARRLPERLKPTPKRTARVLALDTAGRTVHDLEFDASRWHLATGVREHGGRVWLGSLVEPAIAVGEVPGAAGQTRS